MKKYLKNQKGFSMAEVVVGMILLPIVLGMAWFTLSTYLINYRTVMDRAEISQDARGIMTAITREVQNASSSTVTSPAIGTSANAFAHDATGNIAAGTGADSGKVVIIAITDEGTQTIKLPIKNATAAPITFQRDSINKVTITLNTTNKTYQETVTLLN